MANTPNLNLENVNVLLDTDYAYNQLVSEIIAKINNNNLKIDELPNNFISSSQKGVVNGVATLGSDGIIPKTQLPTDSGSVERVTDITARDAITNLYDNKLVFVIDATGDTTVTAGWAMYIYSIASLSWTKIVDGESLDIQLTWDNIANKPITFPPDVHNHEQITINTNNITDLQNNKVDKVLDSRLVSETEIAVFNDKYSKVEVDNKLSALETNIDWKESVATFADIATTYPTPEDGWTVNTRDTDYTYRYNGTEWVTISANAIPKATTEVDGLMPKEYVTQVDTNKTDILSAKTTLGSVAMTTSAQTVTGAINELDADIGDKSTLTTTDKSNLVNAVNETKAQINSLIADSKKYAEFTKTVNQSIPSGANTQVVFETKTPYNEENFCELDGATGRIKILEKGIYEISVTLLYVADSTGVRTINIAGKAVTNVLPQISDTYLTATTFIDVLAGALISIQTSQSTTSALDIRSAVTNARIRQVAKL